MAILDMVQKYGKYKEIAPGVHAGPCPECGGAVRFRIDIELDSGKCQSCKYVLVDPEHASFPADKLRQLISDTYSRVTSQCPVGALKWLEENRPDVVNHLTDVGAAVDAAFAAEDEQELLRQIRNWERWHLAAWQLYQERPEVIER
jgi:hypothetical protein